jgi:hypothetical protein
MMEDYGSQLSWNTDKVAWSVRLTGDQDGPSLAPGEAVGLFKDVDDGSYKEAVATSRVCIVW